jgi:hypothetical protein
MRMATEKKSSTDKGKKSDASDEKGYEGIVRVTESIQTQYTLMEKVRAEEPTSNPEGKSDFQRNYVIMSPKRTKKSRPSSIGSKYV